MRLDLCFSRKDWRWVDVVARALELRGLLQEGPQHCKATRRHLIVAPSMLSRPLPRKHLPRRVAERKQKQSVSTQGTAQPQPQLHRPSCHCLHDIQETLAHNPVPTWMDLPRAAL